MRNDYKVAGQSSPAADTDTDLYTVPVGKSFVGSSICICNRATSGDNGTFRIAVIPSSEILSNKHYIVFDQLIGIRETKTFSLGMTLQEGDKVIVRSDNVNLSFTLFGSEVS